MRIRRHRIKAPSFKDVVEEYYLHALCVPDSVEQHNIATMIQSMHMKMLALRERQSSDRITAVMCRDFIIHAFSIVEALVISMGYKIQKMCIGENGRFPFCSASMFRNGAKKNEIQAFHNANRYLKDIGVIRFSDSHSARFYEEFRQTRNDVHIVKCKTKIEDHPKYRVDYCLQIMEFVRAFSKTMTHNIAYMKKAHKIPERTTRRYAL